MRSVSAALATHLAGEVVTLATLWKIVRTDGQVFGFTDHDQDITISGQTYLSSGGHTSSAISWSSDLSNSNQEVTAVFDNAAITASDVNAGLWDFAAVTLYLVNYADLTMGTLPLTTGVLGQVTLKRGQYVAELRGLAQLLDQEIGSLYSATCRAEFGDSKCKVNLAPYTFTATVTSVTNKRVFGATSLSQVGPTLSYITTPYTVSASSLYVITPVMPQGGTWVSNIQVKKAQTGELMTLVGSSPVKGQYSVSAGVYTFSALDVGLTVTFEFNYSQGYFTYGKVTWLTGGNAGYKMDVRKFSPGLVTLALPMTHDITVGDTFSIVAGCDDTLTTCKTRYNNFVNFRGEPYLPGNDRVLRNQGS